MNCLSCRHSNPATVTYCQRCGTKLDLTADEISASLFEKAKGEQAKSTAYYTRQALIFSIVLFLISLTLFVLSGGAPEDAVHVPSLSGGAKYLKYDYKVEKPIERVEIAVPKKP